MPPHANNTLVQTKVARATLSGYARGVKKSLANPGIMTCLSTKESTVVRKKADQAIQFADNHVHEKPETYYEKQEALKSMYFSKIETGAKHYVQSSAAKSKA